jgi:hypothetical protein
LPVDASFFSVVPLRVKSGFDVAASFPSFAAGATAAGVLKVTGFDSTAGFDVFGTPEAAKLNTGIAGAAASVFCAVAVPAPPKLKVGRDVKIAVAEVEGVVVGADFGVLEAGPKTNGSVAVGFEDGGFAAGALNWKMLELGPFFSLVSPDEPKLKVEGMAVDKEGAWFSLLRKLGALNVNETFASGGLLPFPPLVEGPRAKGLEAGVFD